MSNSSQHVPERIERFNLHVPYYLWALIGSIFLVASLLNIITELLTARRRHRAAFGPPAFCENPKYCTRHLPAAALAVWRKATVTRSRFADALGLGSFGQVLLISAYVGSNLALMLVHTGNTLDYTAHHAARLVVGNLPLVIGLASKNNVISYCTGFSYASLNALHRWAARLTLLLTVVHVVGRSVVNVPPVDPSRTGNGYVRWGIVAFIASAWMIVSATRPIRNKFYQFFIIQHVLCFFLYFIALWIHRPRIYPFLVAGIALYLLDRIARTARIVHRHSFRSFMHAGRRSTDKNTTVEVLRSHSSSGHGGGGGGDAGDTLRVTVETNPDAPMRWVVGQHVYFHVPFLHAGGHPFSVASICESLSPGTGDADADANEDGKLVLLIRVRDGMTRRLRDFALEQSLTAPTRNSTSIAVPNADASATNTDTEAASPLGSARIYAWAEGAYGNLQHLDEFETLVLFAGGSGVSFTLPVMLDVVRRAALFSRNGEKATASNPHPDPEPGVGRCTGRAKRRRESRGAVATAKLHFVWTIKYDEQFEWIGEQLRAAVSAAPPGLLDVHVYITQSPHKIAKETPVEKLPTNPDQSYAATLSASNPSIHFHRGRPDIPSILSTAIIEAPCSHHVGVGACGPVQMTRAVSEAVRDEIWPGAVVRGDVRRSVYLLVEEYGW